MKFIRLAIAGFVAGILACSTAFAGPFGLSAGMTLNEVKKQGTLTEISRHYYEMKNLKNGNPAFEAYMLVITPNQGLCKIVAIGKDVSTSVYGDDLRSTFNALGSALSKKYGTPGDDFDFLRKGSIWDDDRDWMMSLVKKERYLTKMWTDKKTLPDSLVGVALSVNANTTSEGWLDVTYEFSNIDACTEERKAQVNANL